MFGEFNRLVISLSNFMSNQTNDIVIAELLRRWICNSGNVYTRVQISPYAIFSNYFFFTFSFFLIHSFPYPPLFLGLLVLWNS